MSNKQLKYIILACLFLVPFVPLIVSSSLFFPFITGKAFVFRILVELALACYLILAIRDRSYRPRFSWILFVLVAFLIVVGLADLLAINSYKAFWSNYERMEGFVTLLHLGAYFLVLGSVFKTQELWNKLLATSLGASVIMAIYSFLQIGGKITINQGGVRVDGTLGNAGYLGVYMLFHIFFAGLLFLRSGKNWQKVLLSLIAIIDLIIIYFTATRGAILGLLGGALITFIYLLARSEKGNTIRKVAIIGIIAMTFFVGLFISVKDSDFVKTNPVLSRFASLSFSEIKTQGRYYVWPMAWKGFLERPILGWGQEGFNFVFNKYYDPRMYNQEAWFDRAHSTPLDWLVAGGALGFLTYLSIFLALIFYIFKNSGESLSKNEKAIMLGLVSAYFFNNIFVFDQISSYILFFTVLAYVHSHSVDLPKNWMGKMVSKLRNYLEDPRIKPMIEALILILLITAAYLFVYAPWRQNKELLAVLKSSNEGKIEKIEFYSKPFSHGYGMGFSESLEHTSQLAMSIISNPNAGNEIKQQLFEMLDKAFVKQIDKAPTDARYRLFYGIFLSRYGWYGKAVEQLNEALKNSPKKQQIHFELTSNLLLDNKTEEAVNIAKAAYDFEPSYKEAKTVYGLTLLAAGKETEAQNIFKDTPENELIFDDRYLSVLMMKGRFDQMISIAQKRIQLDPSQQNYVTLVSIYLKAERRSEAVATLRKMIEIFPALKEQGEYYIKEIEAGRNP